MVSTAVYEPMGDVRDFVRNFQHFTAPGTTLVLHLNALANYTSEEVRELRGMERVLVNPRRFEVHWGSAAITAALLSNVAFFAAQAPHPSPPFAAVLLDSNMMWFRPCMEAYVRASGSCVRAEGAEPPKSFRNEFDKELAALDDLGTSLHAFVTANGTRPLRARAPPGIKSSKIDRVLRTR